MSPFFLVPCGSWAVYVPILTSEVEQGQRPNRNGDREVIVVGAGLCDENRTFRKKNWRRFGNFFMSKRPVLSWFCFWFSTNWLDPVCRKPKTKPRQIPVCRILELKKNDKTINVGMKQSIKRASVMSSFPLVPRGPSGPLIFPSC